MKSHKISANAIFRAEILFRIFILSFFFAVCIVSAPVYAVITVHDNTGHSLSLNKPATRIVSAYATFNDLLIEMGLKNYIAGRTLAESENKTIADVPVIGTHMRPDPEAIVQIQPDVVLLMTGRKEVDIQYDTLQKFGLKVLQFRIASFDDLFDVVRALGEITDKQDAAERIAADWKARIEAVHDRTKDKQAVRVFFEIRYPNLLAAGQGGITNEIISLAGGKNVVMDEKKLVRLNEEELYRLDPDVYILQRGPMNPGKDTPALRGHYAALRAVQQGKVLTVEERSYSRPGPQSIKAVEQLSYYLHPEDSEKNK